METWEIEHQDVYLSETTTKGLTGERIRENLRSKFRIYHHKMTNKEIEKKFNQHEWGEFQYRGNAGGLCWKFWITNRNRHIGKRKGIVGEHLLSVNRFEFKNCRCCNFDCRGWAYGQYKKYCLDISGDTWWRRVWSRGFELWTTFGKRLANLRKQVYFWLGHNLWWDTLHHQWKNQRPINILWISSGLSIQRCKRLQRV